MSTPVTSTPSTVDMSDYPAIGLAYDDPFAQASHNNKIVTAKELAQIQRVALDGRTHAQLEQAGAGVSAGAISGTTRAPYSLVLTKTDSFSIQPDMPSNMLVLMNPSTTGKAVTLPNPKRVKAGWTITVKKINSSTTNTVGINRNASETIDGRSASDVLKAQYAYAVYMCDGTNWHVLAVNDRFESTVASGTNVSAGTDVYFAGITLTSVPPGEWDASALVYANPNSDATATDVVVGIASASDGTLLTFGTNAVIHRFPSTSSPIHIAIPSYRLLLSAAQTHYLVLRFTYTAGGNEPQYGCRLSLRRVG